MKKAEGILIHRLTNGKIEVLLVHSNGREDLEARSLPKGEFGKKFVSEQWILGC